MSVERTEIPEIFRPRMEKKKKLKEFLFYSRGKISKWKFVSNIKLRRQKKEKKLIEKKQFGFAMVGEDEWDC